MSRAGVPSKPAAREGNALGAKKRMGFGLELDGRVDRKEASSDAGGMAGVAVRGCWGPGRRAGCGCGYVERLAAVPGNAVTGRS